MKQSEHKLRAIFDSLPDFIFFKDKDLKYVAANRALEQFLGVKPGEIIGKTDFDVMPREAAHGCLETDRAVLQLGFATAEETVAGRIYATIKQNVIDEAGNSIGVAGSIRDITQYKETEKELENIFDLSPDMVCVCTTDGGLLKVNPSCERILGYTQEEMLNIGWNKLVHPDDVEPTNKEFARQLECSSIANFVNRYRHKDGSYVTLEW